MSLLLLTVLLVPEALATAQVPDAIEVHGQVLPLMGQPLQVHFGQWRSTTACHSGVVGSWEIDEGMLWLVGLQECSGGKELDLRKYWPETWEDGRVPATWVSERLRVGQGEVARYIHGGWESTFERELLLEVDEGRVVGRELVVYRPEGFVLFQGGWFSTFLPSELAEGEIEREWEDEWASITLTHPSRALQVRLARAALPDEEQTDWWVEEDEQTRLALAEERLASLVGPRRATKMDPIYSRFGAVVEVDHRDGFRRRLCQVVVVTSWNELRARVELKGGSREELQHFCGVIGRGLSDQL